ncbi:MAG TPA: tetratricopeptide repeat protein [Allosphingosinicella sp.]|nr:tetratricopeptide repeat protein [Allosphingosinicella sp.]
MGGWLVMIVLTLLAGAGLGSFLRHDKGALQFLAAALLLALAGYSWQGHPGLPGAPRRPPAQQQLPDTDFANLRGDVLGRFDRAWYWLNMADGFQRRGDTEGAARILQTAVRRNPRDPDLWVGLGNSLVIHGGGMMSPAAQLAFGRAASLAPDHPGPPFFYGLALAQGGNYDEAERIWRGLLAGAPAQANYRRLIEERLRALEQARASGRIPGPAPVPAGSSPTSNSQ